MSTYVATELRAIAANPTPDAICDLYRLAGMVERYERLADDMFQQAREAELLAMRVVELAEQAARSARMRARTVAALAKLTEVAR